MKHLKLFFALFAMLALGVGNAWGAETVETISYSNHKGKGTSSTGSAHTMNGDKFSITDSKFYCDATKTYAQFYANSTITITPNTGVTIKNIVITASSSSYNGFQSSGTFTPSIGSVTKTDDTHITWAGSATSEFTISHTKQIRWTAIEVTYEETTSGGGENPGEGGGEDPVDPTPGTGESGTIVIKYNSTFAPALPTASGSVNTTATAHTAEGLSFKEKGIYKGSSNNYLMFTSGKGFLYNTQSLGTITSVSVTYTSGTSTSGKAGVYFGTTEQSTYINTSNSTIAGQSQTDTWTNTTEGNGFFQLSTSNKNVQITQIEITYTSGGSTETVPSLTLDPTSKDFATVMVGEEASQEFTITPKNTTATLSASISDEINYAISGIENNKITVTYKPQSAADKHEAVLTVEAGKEATATVNLTGKAVEALEGTWELVTDASILKNGDQVIIAAKEANIALSTTQNNNNRAGVEVTKSGNTIAATSATQVLTLVDTEDSDVPFALQAGSSYLYAASSSGNQLKTKAELDDNGKWVITITDGTASVVASKSSNRNVMQYNPNNGNPIFTCYSSASQSALSLYRKAGTKYNVTVSSTTNGTVTADPTSAEAGTTITLTVTPVGGYVLEALTVTDASSNPVTVTDNKFTMPASDVTVTATFKENEKPAATLTLSKNGETEDITGYKQDDKVTLPSITSDCVKAFVGWSADANCATEPEYKAGDEYTLAETAQTLYAVYADAEEGELINVFTETFDACNGTGGNDNQWSGSIASTAFPDALKNTWTVANAYAANKCAKFGGSSNKQGSAETPSIALIGTATLTFRAAAWNGSSEGTTLNVTATGATLDMTSVTLTKGAWNTYTVAITNASGSVKVKFEAENASSNRFFLDDVVVSQTSVNYSNYSTTCAAAPKAEVNPTEVTATAAGAEGKVTVTYENVNTANVSVALYNDAACTEAFTADWLTASLDGDKNITYTVTATTLYTERKAYIQLTAPEANGTTEPAKVVIPVTQAGKEKVFASLEELLANITPTTEGVEVTVTLTNELIVDFYTSGSYRNGIALNVPYQDGTKQIEIYCKDVPAEWVKGGKVSGTITCPWKLFNSTWELCPAAWTELTYTAPATVKSIAVSGTPTKTTYVDGEAFDPTGLVVTATLTDDSTEPIEFALVDWTFDPATLAKGQTSVNVTAQYNTLVSPAYEVTGLTVNDIPTKTIAEFIDSEGGRCYLEGIVSGLTEGNSMKYGNFDLTDASGTIYVYGCLNEAGESQKFADLGVKNGDKIKVIADEYELYGGTKDEAMNVQYVSHVSAASITIYDITMEVDEVATITATVDPADAVVTYTIKENAANAISLNGNTITALAEGIATITATVAEGATYLGNSVDFTVTVGPKTVSDEVVILAELDGKWYAMKGAAGSGTGQLAALEVTYFNGTLYNVAEADKASITWTRSVVDGKATFVNNGKYLKGKDGDLSLVTTADNNCEWTSESGFYTTGNNRTFIYRDNYNFKNYSVQNVGKSGYSGFPEVVVPVYATGDIVYTRTVTNKYGTICLPYASASTSGAYFYRVAGKETGKVYLESVDALEAGVPYIFEKTANTITVTCQGEAVAEAASANGLVGNFTNEFIVPANNYILYSNAFIPADGTTNKVNAYRAYLDMDAVTGGAPVQMPGRRYIGMDVQGENVETGVEDLFTTDAPVKVIENGQLIIIRDGVKYNVQGQKL